MKVSNFRYFITTVYQNIFCNRQMKILLLPIILLMVISNIAEFMIKGTFALCYSSFDTRSSFDFTSALLKGVFYTASHYLLAYIYLVAFLAIVPFLRSAIIENYMQNYLNMEYSDYLSLGTGKIYSLIILQSEALIECIRIFIVEFLYDVTFFGICIYKVFSSSRRDTGIYVTFLSMLVILLAFVFITSKSLYMIRKKYIHSQNIASKKVYDILRNFGVIKSFNNENKETQKLRRQLNLVAKDERSYNFSSNTFSFIYRIVMFSYQIFIIISCYKLLLVKDCSTEKIIAYMGLFSLFKKRISKIKSNSFKFAQFYSDITAREIEIVKGSDANKCSGPEHSKSLQFKNVAIKSLISNFNLDIEKGQKIAVTGSNGSGKSTILKSLMGFCDYYGDILIDGIQISTIKEKSLRGLISYVPQDPHLLDTTVWENLTYGASSSLSEEQIIETCKRFGTHKLFSSLPDGYHTMVGENGQYLSGGQAQLLNFMRAVIKDAPIFVLDEPTSNLDYCTSNKLIDLVFRHLSCKTVILSTHNPLHLTRFDKIINIKNNQVNVFESLEEFKASENGEMAL
jgi:ABC-type multidrug transport system fused ATPase/permease subunit